MSSCRFRAGLPFSPSAFLAARRKSIRCCSRALSSSGSDLRIVGSPKGFSNFDLSALLGGIMEEIDGEPDCTVELSNIGD